MCGKFCNFLWGVQQKRCTYSRLDNTHSTSQVLVMTSQVLTFNSLFVSSAEIQHMPNISTNGH